MSVNLLNQLQCNAAIKNTGFGSCVLQPDRIIGAIICPIGYILANSSMTSISAAVAALITAASVDNKLSRIFPVHNLDEITDSTEKKVVQTRKYGAKYVVREGDYDWAFDFTQGGICELLAVRSFNSNGSWAILFYDSNFVLYGIKTATGLQAIPTKMLWADPWAPNDGSALAKYMIGMVFLPKYINEMLGYVQLDYTLASVIGLQDVTPNLISWTEGSGVTVVQVNTSCGTVNMGAIYGTALAHTAAWVAKNATTGLVIAIATATYSATTGYFTITLTTGDANYPTGTQGATLDLGAVSALVAQSVIGFESTGALTLPTT